MISGHPRKAAELSYFQVKYKNSSSDVDTLCGTGPDLEAMATSIEFASGFTLYCDNPPIVRSLTITADRSQQFELCEVNVAAERIGKCSATLNTSTIFPQI